MFVAQWLALQTTVTKIEGSNPGTFVKYFPSLTNILKLEHFLKNKFYLKDTKRNSKINTEKYRKVQKTYRKVQKSTEKYRNVQKSTEKYRKVQKNTENIQKEVQK